MSASAFTDAYEYNTNTRHRSIYDTRTLPVDAVCPIHIHTNIQSIRIQILLTAIYFRFGIVLNRYNVSFFSNFAWLTAELHTEINSLFFFCIQKRWKRSNSAENEPFFFIGNCGDFS